MFGTLRQFRFLRVLSRCLLSISKDGASSASRGTHISAETCSGERLFLMLTGLLQVMAVVLSQGHYEQRLALSSLGKLAKYE